MSFTLPHRCALAHVPTPIEKLERLSQFLEGPEIYIKRDDLTGMGKTGNKVRKLEFLVAEALREGCQLLITCGGLQSNHARATALAAAKVGIKSHLVLRDSAGGDIDGNLFIDRLVGAEVTFISPQEYEQANDIMHRLADDYARRGVKAYVIPEGGSTALGALGYVVATEELYRQMKAMRLEFDHIVSAIGSGGTMAGLLLGKSAYDVKAQIHGINVCDDAPYFQERVSSIIREAKRRFGFEINVQKKDVSIIDGYVGKGYGLSRQEEIELIKLVARTEGIILDPVYTAKAMYGLMDQIRKGRFTRQEKVLFWHTGGIFGLFPKRGLFF
ncbi:MAG: D-cysteine desulfhydrase family protein [candidate division KSB1 bacterium]|nr:D-cysteine desulfhydrase family protein [candidate division KSB1 bacterium]MDZ7301321.1 D-cysteine desulfhydrase family protein [candidate division KSB1 bacterium]MDZ7310794.1 D-cysteine desulfhydrase family protein [candidate division KSB1 bacterium]